MPEILAKGAADQAVRLTAMDHHGGDGGGVGAQHGAGNVGGHAAPLHQQVIGFPVIAVARIVFRVHNLKIPPGADRQAGPFAAPLDHVGAADQDRHTDIFLDHRIRGAQHPFILALGKDDAALGGAGDVEHRPHDKRGAKDRGIQMLLVGRQIGNRALGHPGFHRGLGHRTGHHPHQAGVKRLWDQVIGAKAHLFALIGGGGFGAGGGPGQRGNPVDAGQFHGVVDLGRADIQRAAKDEGETQHVIDLIGIIRPAGGDDRIGRHRAGIGGADFRRRVGQRKDDRARGHFRHHVGRQYPGAGQAKEQIGPVDHLIQRAQVGGLGIGGFLIGHLVGAAGPDQPGQIAQPDILAEHPQFQQHVQTGDPGSTAAGGHDLDLVKAFPGHMQRVGGGGPDHDGGAVLIVVKHRNRHPLAAQLFHHETVGGLDILQIDRAKGRFQRADDVGQLVGVRLVQFDVETVDVGEFLEQNRLALHHRL